MRLATHHAKRFTVVWIPIHSGFTQLKAEPPVRLKHENLETIIRNNKGTKIAEYRVEFNLCLTCLNLLLMDTFDS